MRLSSQKIAIFVQETEVLNALNTCLKANLVAQAFYNTDGFVEFD